MRKLPRSLKHRDNQFATVVEDNVARRSEKVIDCKLRIFYHHFRNGTLSPLYRPLKSGRKVSVPNLPLTHIKIFTDSSWRTFFSNSN